MEKKLKIILDFMVTNQGIAKMKNTLMIDKPTKIKILIQDLKVPLQMLIDPNVGLSNLRDNWRGKQIIKILKRN